MSSLIHLFEKNRAWAAEIKAREPEFFAELARQQSPQYLWIGCSDSRVPANQITGLMPGEIFVHRNIGNVVVHTDFNCLSVMEFAVDVLKVKHIIVCGHYGCNGVRAAMDDLRIGIATNWLRNIQDVCHKHCAMLDCLDDPARRAERLCELNAIEQAINVCQTTIVRDAWERGQELTIHSWVYGISDGLLRDLHVSVASATEIAAAHRAALAAL
ncbi:MAG: carbonic anhydrase [Chthoniobacter sp.]|jgi:carbonic anhydrase|nr:carbonic anhydrase [Chthoniobacter sp.]